jgi:hypothetical protein
MKMHRPVALAGLILACSAASAQLVSGAALERPTINAGETAKLTVNFEVPSGTNCGLRVHWGDGSADNFKINQTKDVPLVAGHAYAKPGAFTVKVEPKGQGMMTPKCGGNNRQVALNVKAPAKAEATKTEPVKAAPAKAPAKVPAKAAQKPAKSASSIKAS